MFSKFICLALFGKIFFQYSAIFHNSSQKSFQARFTQHTHNF